MSKRKAAPKKPPVAVPFPDLLRRTLGLIQARQQRDVNDAVLDTMKMLDLDVEEWVVDLNGQRFVWRQTEPQE